MSKRQRQKKQDSKGSINPTFAFCMRQSRQRQQRGEAKEQSEATIAPVITQRGGASGSQRGSINAERNRQRQK